MNGESERRQSHTSAVRGFEAALGARIGLARNELARSVPFEARGELNRVFDELHQDCGKDVNALIANLRKKPSAQKAEIEGSDP
jgi:hypothetical protein